jgi:hypothetical protein
MNTEVGNRSADPETDTRREIGWIDNEPEDDEDPDSGDRRPAPRPEILLPGRHYQLE